MWYDKTDLSGTDPNPKPPVVPVDSETVRGEHLPFWDMTSTEQQITPVTREIMRKVVLLNSYLQVPET